MNTPLEPAQREAVLRIVAIHKPRPGCLLEVLHGVNDALGHVPSAAIPLIADELNLSRAEVHGVISFYHHFRHAAPGRHVVQICRAEACQAWVARSGGARSPPSRNRIQANDADGAFTLEPVYCLGNCACSPALMVDGELHRPRDAGAF